MTDSLHINQLSLFTLQEKFQAYLLANKDPIQNSIISTPQVSAAQRLEIYRNAYQCRLIEALTSNYPMLTYHLKKTFDELALKYLAEYPSQHYSIRWFGSTFPEYLSIEENLIETDAVNKPYLSELAEFEWKLSLAFDAQDEQHLTIEPLVQLPLDAWPQLSFKPQKSVQIAYFHWDVPTLWKSINAEQESSSHLSELPSLAKLIKSPISKGWIIWRKNFECHFYCLSPEEGCAWEALSQGKNFASICDSLYNWFEHQNNPKSESEISLLAASLLKTWIESELLSSTIKSTT